MGIFMRACVLAACSRIRNGTQQDKQAEMGQWHHKTEPSAGSVTLNIPRTTFPAPAGPSQTLRPRQSPDPPCAPSLIPHIELISMNDLMDGVQCLICIRTDLRVHS